MARRAKIIVSPTPEDITEQVAELFVNLADASVLDHERFSVSLAGGNTPRLLYQQLAKPPFLRRVDWARVDIFFGDERCVPPDHPDSNFRLVYDTLISQVPIPAENVHRMKGEGEPVASAADYDMDLRTYFSGLSQARFDLVLVGMGTDGHTASLFPNTEVLNEKEKWVAANWIEKLNAYRMTLTAAAINGAANVAFLVTGADKAETLRDVLQGPERPQELPAQLINPIHGALTWFVDRAAASLLK